MDYLISLQEPIKTDRGARGGHLLLGTTPADATLRAHFRRSPHLVLVPAEDARGSIRENLSLQEKFGMIVRI